MKTKKPLFYLLAGVLVGCVPVMSLHPLYNKQDVVFEEKLLGKWVDDANETTWEFKRLKGESEGIYQFDNPEEPEKAYELVFCNNEDYTRGLFFVHLVKLDNEHFLNVYPRQFPCAKPDPNNTYPYNIFFLVPVHTFIKVDSIEPQLRMWLTDDGDMKKLLKEDPNAVKHEFVEDRLILTASTKELQAFVLKYADDNRVFSEEIVLTRKKAKTSNKSDMTDPNATGQNKE